MNIIVKKNHWKSSRFPGLLISASMSFIFNSELVVAIAPGVSYSQTITMNGITLCVEIVSPKCDTFQVSDFLGDMKLMFDLVHSKL